MNSGAIKVFSVQCEVSITKLSKSLLSALHRLLAINPLSSPSSRGRNEYASHTLRGAYEGPPRYFAGKWTATHQHLRCSNIRDLMNKSN